MNKGGAAPSTDRKYGVTDVTLVTANDIKFIYELLVNIIKIAKPAFTAYRY